MKTKRIEFRMELKGRGVVNFDENTREKRILCGCNDGNENHKIAKSVYYRNAEGEICRTLKISSACLRHHIFSGDVSFITASAFNDETFTKHFLSTPYAMLRGYTILNKGGLSLIKKSALSIVDAVETEGTPIIQEFQTNSVYDISDGEEDEKKSDGGVGIVNVDNVGDVTYSCHGFISLFDLQFMSADPVLGRMNLCEKWVSDLAKIYEGKYGRVPFKDGRYSSSTATMGDAISEYGILFDDEFVGGLVKQQISRLLGLSVERAQAEAHVSKLEVRFIGCLADRMKDDNWVEVDAANYESVVEDGLSEGVFAFYKEV